MSEEFEGLVGKPIPQDELKAALEFEDFDSKEQMMCGWRKVHRELHVVAVAYRKAESSLAASQALASRLAKALEETEMHIIDLLDPAARDSVSEHFDQLERIDVLLKDPAVRALIEQHEAKPK